MSESMKKVRSQLLKPQTRNDVVPNPSLHIRKLRGGLLLLKLLSVLSTIRIVDSQLQKAMVSIWTALGTMALGIAGEIDNNSMQTCELPEAQQLSVHITRLAIPAMRQVVKADAAGSYCVCLMLEQLMASNTPTVYRAVASELITDRKPLTACLPVFPFQVGHLISTAALFTFIS